MSEIKDYGKGILGGFIGGCIATIPWILTYVYANRILAILSVVVALGVLKGYQVFKGKIDEKLPIFIAILSVLSITLATFFAIPILLFIKENIPFHISTIKYLLSNNEFISALVKDYIVSLLFTFLGISGILKNIKNQIDNYETETIKINFQNNVVTNNNQEKIEMFREAFKKLDAFKKENAVEKEKIIEEIENPDAKIFFKNLRVQQIIAKYKGKYYFKEKYANSVLKRFLKLFFMIYGFLIVVVVLIIFLITL